MSACQRVQIGLIALSAIVAAGCGTTRSTDTGRTATEQLLISDAIDRAVASIDLGQLTGQSVYFDDQYLQGVVDQPYLISSIRQHLLASGSVLKHNREEAEFVVEARAGAIGTDRHDLLFGIPSMNLPQIFPLQGVPAAIPEVPVAKRRDQRGIAKVAVFAYHRETGLPVWQSGIAQQQSSLNDVWILGAGPFQHGTIRRGPAFAGQYADAKRGLRSSRGAKPEALSTAQQAVFADPERLASGTHRLPDPPSPVELAGATSEDADRPPAEFPGSDEPSQPISPPPPEP